MTDFLDFVADFEAPRTVEAHDELPLWSAMFAQLFALRLTSPAAYLEATTT